MKLFRRKSWINHDGESYLTLLFLVSASDVGLLKALRKPADRNQLIEILEVERPELLGRLLDLGVSVGQLRVYKGQYAIGGSRARALIQGDQTPLVSLMKIWVSIYASVYDNLADRMRGAPLGNYWDGTGDLMAKACNVHEPFIHRFMSDVVKKDNPLRILDVGCGTATYLRRAADINPQATGVGIDMRADVVALASENLTQWGLKEQFKVVSGDIWNPPAEMCGPFDVILMFNNVYYFPEQDRPNLFRRLKSILSGGGVMAMVSMMQGSNLSSVNLDLLLSSTDGGGQLPE